MDSDYLYSIVNLYLRNETDSKKTALNIKKLDDQVEFNFDMNEKNSEKTNFLMPYDMYRAHLNNFLNLYKQELLVIDEKYKSNKETNICDYYVQFKNGRSISFSGFSILEMNDIRNILFNIEINKNEIRMDGIDEEKHMVYQPRLRLQQAGFSSMATLFMVIIFFADLLVIILWIVKSLTN